MYIYTYGNTHSTSCVYSTYSPTQFVGQLPLTEIHIHIHHKYGYVYNVCIYIYMSTPKALRVYTLRIRPLSSWPSSQ